MTAADQCTYCGALATTRDHVPARTIYKAPFPPDLPTVPSCRECNESAAKDDEYFRDVILKHYRITELPQAQAQVAAMLRAAARPEARRYLERVMASFRQVAVRTPGGVVLPNQPAYIVDRARMDGVAQRYIRGLYRWQTGERLPDYIAVETVANPHHLEPHRAEVEQLLSGPTPTTIQEGVFWFTWRPAAENRETTVWLLVFFDEYAILGFTLHRARLATLAV